MRVGIIGAGIGGIAAAIRLAAKGHAVDVFEANSYPGGKLSELRLDDYRFDAGPSLFTMPQYVTELFELTGKDPDDYFNYEKLPVVCKYFWEDGTSLTAHADKNDFAREVKEQLGVPADRVLKSLADSERKYQVSGEIFLNKSLHRAGTWLSGRAVKAMLKIPGLDLFTTMDAVNRRILEHPKLVQLFNRYATYNGSNPYKAPGLLSIIPHFEYGFGAYFPKGGMHQITLSLCQLAAELGVQFHFNQKVERIIVADKRATGIQLADSFQSFDRVVSNMDVYPTYRKLLSDQPQPETTLSQKRSTSALIFYWGVKDIFPKLDLHNIFFSDDYKKEFDELDAGRIYEDPTVYVNITSKYHPSDAPAGCENWFTMINVPHNQGQDWDELIRSAREHIQQKLSRVLNIDLSRLIECEDILDPRRIEQRTSSYLGALYGTSSNNRLAAFLRHPNFSSRIRHLYFCGGSVHPGGGIPLSLLSAKIVAREMTE